MEPSIGIPTFLGLLEQGLNRLRIAMLLPQ